MARFFLYQNVTKPTGDFPNPEDITLDKWWEPLSEPVRHKIAPKLAVALIVSGCFWTPTEIAGPIAITTQSSPVFFNRRLIYQSVATTYFQQEVVTVDKWFLPFTDPVREKRGLRSSLQQTTTADTRPNVSFDWMVGLSLPPKAKTSVRPAAQHAAVPPPFVEDTTFESKWHQTWSEPVRFRRGLYAYQQPFATVANVFPLEPIFEDKWHYPWSEPVRQKPGLSARYQQFVSWIPLPDDSITGTMESRWHFPWSEPVRLKKGLGARYQVDLAWGYFTPETTTPDKWFIPLSEPVRVRPALRSGLQQVSVTDTDPIVSFSWFNGLAEPPKPKVSIRLGSQQFFGTDTDPIVSFSWFANLSDPVRQKPGLAARFQQFSVWDALPDDSITGTMESRWHQPWSEPVRFKRLLAAQQQDLAWESVFVTEFIFEDKWHQAWSEPVRIKRGLAAYEQQAAVFAPTPPIVSFSYFNWLNEPVRLKKGLASHEQQFISQWTNPVVSFGYYGWLTEPVRLKKGLQARLQMPVAEPSAQPNLPDLRTSWFAPFSEPVRQKKGLWARLQQFFTYGAPSVSGPAVTVVLDATETNADTAEFYAVVYNRPVRAVVSFKEIPRIDSANASFEET